MKRSVGKYVTLVVAFTCLQLLGCGSDSNNPISAFEPEIVNTADAFQFQITDASDVTTTLSYTWSNAGNQAIIDHSTATNAGTATVQLLDAESSQVYASTLAASLNETSAEGVPSDWTVRIIFKAFSGTVNFRVEKN